MAFRNREGVRNDDPWNNRREQEFKKKKTEFVNSRKEEKREKLVNQDSYSTSSPSAKSPENYGEHTVNTVYTQSSSEETRASLRKRKNGCVAKTIIIVIAAYLLFSAGTFLDWFFSEPEPEPYLPNAEYGENFEIPEAQVPSILDENKPFVAGTNDIERAEPNPEIDLDVISNEPNTLSLQDIYSKCAVSIVGITATLDGADYSWGSGIVMTADGYIVTNSHILDGTDGARISLSDGTEVEAILVGHDAMTDLAVLKAEGAEFIPAEFGDSELLEVGDNVVAIGNPLSAELSGTMTDGIVSAINRDIYIDGNNMTLIQTNAAINNGNSGGALIDEGGRVVGITNMKMTSFYNSIEGIGFAIPTSMVKFVVDEIMERGYVSGRPGFGVTVSSLTTEQAENYPEEGGLYVSHVTPDSGADLAGIQMGDIIMSAEGEVVFTPDDLNIVKEYKAVGDFVLLAIYRDGESFDVEVELMDMNDLF